MGLQSDSPWPLYSSVWGGREEPGKQLVSELLLKFLSSHTKTQDAGLPFPSVLASVLAEICAGSAFSLQDSMPLPVPHLSDPLVPVSGNDNHCTGQLH